MNKQYPLFIILIFLMNQLIYAGGDDKEREIQQKRLDQVCETAREKKLVPERIKFIKECIENGQSESNCKNFYKDYGIRSGDRAPLYLDLPECVKAFEYSNSYRDGS